jgi:hypothetical protein
MGVPGIFSNHPSMTYIKQSEYDYLEANNREEFVDKCRLLKTNNEYYKQMIQNCDKRRNEFNNSLIIDQINNIIKIYNRKLIYET